ncbi:MAG TPA: class I SAM-dependent methyltransferase [Pseudolabrys sp.]|nr:class I SAM-dependent methyltransferase [Pseudolabrys sp.]
MGLKSYLHETITLARVNLKRRLHSKWDSYPLGRKPRADAEKYLKLFDSAKRTEYPEADAVERESGFAIDREWLHDVALHTQVAIKSYKDGVIAYPHGRLLYSLLRRYIADNRPDFINIAETGTARGFSALCMAKAIADSGIHGRIVTIDLLPHVVPMYWNCIDDHKGPRTRAELLSPWSDLLRHIVFLQGNSLELLLSVGVDRIHFAFLDACHIEIAVMAEFKAVEARQKPGDIIFFDDVTPGVFPGVVKAIDRIGRSGNYSFRRTMISDRRGYAWGTRQPVLSGTLAK